MGDKQQTPQQQPQQQQPPGQQQEQGGAGFLHDLFGNDFLKQLLGQDDDGFSDEVSPPADGTDLGLPKVGPGPTLPGPRRDPTADPPPGVSPRSERLSIPWLRELPLGDKAEGAINDWLFGPESPSPAPIPTPSLDDPGACSPRVDPKGCQDATSPTVIPSPGIPF